MIICDNEIEAFGQRLIDYKYDFRVYSEEFDFVESYFDNLSYDINEDILQRVSQIIAEIETENE